jgi:hypothetical protein
MSDQQPGWPPPPPNTGWGAAPPPAPGWPTPAPAPAPWGLPGPGIPGQRCNPGLQILLTVATLGTWPCVWVYRQHRDIHQYSGAGVGGGVGFVLYFFLSPVTYFLLPGEVAGNLYGRLGGPSPVGTLTGFWLLLPLFGPLIWYLKVQGALNDFWAGLGVR